MTVIHSKLFAPHVENQPVPVAQRIEMIALRNAKKVIRRYGSDARAHCIRKTNYCARYARGVRWLIWCRSYNFLLLHTL